MWLINARTLKLESFEGDRTPPYAILSHRWEDDEVSFKSMQKQRCQNQKGYRKIQACCELTLEDNLEYAWVDTCCIDKRSSAELSEAINSMFRWYQRSVVCYAFLSDIISQPFTESLWFTRGWTLQELLAPNKVEFFDSTWKFIGSKQTLAPYIEGRTGIPSRALENFNPADYCVGKKMRWAANRYTTRVEDRAYSLLGIFQINMPLLYGEAENAFLRLQREIMEVYDDVSILMATSYLSQSSGILASCPESFGLFEFGDVHGYQQSFTPTNRGIVGEFDLYRYVLDTYFVCLCPMSMGPQIYLLVQWNFSARRFQRVAIDGKPFLTAHTSSHGLRKKLEINIGRLPIIEVSSTSLSNQRLLSYLPGITFLRGVLAIVPGQFSDFADARPGNNPEPKLLFGTSLWESSARIKQCLCIHSGSQYDGTVQPSSGMVVHFGHKSYEPTAFLSRMEGTWQSEVDYKRQECQIDTFCWYPLEDDCPPLARLEDPEQELVYIDKLSNSDHKVVMLGDYFNIHFVRHGESWRVYVECSPGKFLYYIPRGWLLPEDGRVAVE